MIDGETNKTVPIIKLGLWLIFIIILVIVVRFSGNNENTTEINNQNEVKEEIAYQDKLDKLNNNYKYSYEIKINDKLYNFVGSKMDKKESGYRILNEEYLYYFLENGYVYQVNNGGLDKIETIYDNIDVNNIDIVKIKESIINQEYTSLDNKYSYILENKNIDIFTDEENITKIEIYIDEDYYKLEYSDVGVVSEIKY